MTPWEKLPTKKRRWAVYDAIRHLGKHTDPPSILAYVKLHYNYDLPLGRLHMLLGGLVHQDFLTYDRHGYHLTHKRPQ